MLVYENRNMAALGMQPVPRRPFGGPIRGIGAHRDGQPANYRRMNLIKKETPVHRRDAEDAEILFHPKRLSLCGLCALCER